MSVIILLLICVYMHLPGTVSQVNKALMNYKNYDIQIVQKYGVKLVGWTYTKMSSPSEISTVDDIHSLRDMLRCGACHWIWLSKAEVTRHAKGIEAQETVGEVVGTKRKERSDKGVAKGPRKRHAVAAKGGNPETATQSRGKGKA